MKIITNPVLQLLFAFIFAVGMPVFLLVENPTTRDIPLFNSGLASLLAISIGFFTWKKLDLFQVVDGGIYVFYSFLPPFMIMFSLFLFLRLNYSVVIFFYALAASLVFFISLHLLQAIFDKPTFLVIPGGKVDELLQIQKIEWDFLNESELVAINSIGDRLTKNPILTSNRKGIVADLRASHSPKAEALISEAMLAGIPVFHYRRLEEVLVGKITLDYLSDHDFGSIIPYRPYFFLKSILDRFYTIVFFPLLLILIGLVALTVLITDGRPIFFRQERIGYLGKPFVLWKFRTMVRSSYKNQSGVLTMTDTKNVMEVTSNGKRLRKLRLDELPQIYNILKGEMSWIGPRPESTKLVAQISKKYPVFQYRHSVKPGLTGWAQINQGHVVTLDEAAEKLKYDFYYIKHCSPWLDAVIALRTVYTVLSRFGAK